MESRRKHGQNHHYVARDKDELIAITRNRLSGRGLEDCAELMGLATLVLSCTEGEGECGFRLECRIAPEVAMKFAGRTLEMEKEIGIELGKIVAAYSQARLADVEIITVRG